MNWTLARWGLVSTMAAVGAVGAVVALWQSTAEAYEAPDYTVETAHEGWEVRVYASAVEARVTVDGAFEDAINRGFGVLGGYIFGGNEAKQKIAMTVPVTAIPSVEPTVERVDAVGANRWTITFMMPGEYAAEDLPVPLDDRVQFVITAPERVAVRRFSGGVRSKRAARATAELLAAIGEAGVEGVGKPRFAYYDPPWVPAPLRRNEVIVPLGPAQSSQAASAWGEQSNTASK
ncbi:MAG: heme-binding protein [Myxococcota bacterium]